MRNLSVCWYTVASQDCHLLYSAMVGKVVAGSSDIGSLVVACLQHTHLSTLLLSIYKSTLLNNVTHPETLPPFLSYWKKMADLL